MNLSGDGTCCCGEKCWVFKQTALSACGGHRKSTIQAPPTLFISTQGAASFKKNCCCWIKSSRLWQPGNQPQALLLYCFCATTISSRTSLLVAMPIKDWATLVCFPQSLDVKENGTTSHAGNKPKWEMLSLSSVPRSSEHFSAAMVRDCSP